MSDDRKLHDTIGEIVEKRVTAERGQRSMRVTVDPSYAAGNPKVQEPGDAVVGSDTVPILMSYGSVFVRASDSALQESVNDQPVLSGKIVTIEGSLYTGAYRLLPVEMPSSTVFSTPTQTANGIRAFRFHLQSELRVASVHYEIVTAAGGASGGFAIYSSDAGTKLIDAGGQSFASNGVIPVDVTDKTLLPGWYWLAWVIDSVTPTLRSVPAPANFGVLNSGTVQKGTSAGSSTAGSLPASLGAITGSTFDLPVVKLQG